MPAALRLAECMAALGLFTTRIDAYGGCVKQCRVRGTEGPEDARRLASELMGRLIELGMPADAATQEHVDTLFSSWQLPMYHLDFTNIDVSLDDLKAQQEAMFWSEFGGYRFDCSRLVGVARPAHGRALKAARQPGDGYSRGHYSAGGGASLKRTKETQSGRPLSPSSFNFRDDLK